MNPNFIIPRDILNKIGTFSDYRSFINLLSTCKTYYNKKDYLLPQIYDNDVVHYTNFGPIYEKLSDSVKMAVECKKTQYIESMFQIVPTVNLTSNMKRTYLDGSDIISSGYMDDKLLDAEFPTYSMPKISDIINKFVRFVVYDNIFTFKIIKVPFTNVIFKFGDKREIIYCNTSTKHPNDIIIDVMQIVDNYDRIHQSQSFMEKNIDANSFLKYIYYGTLITGISLSTYAYLAKI